MLFRSDWVQDYLIRDHSFWEIPIPHNCSWTWRKILQLREEICPLMRYSIGNGISTSLWFDPWLPFGPIVPTFGDRIIYDSGLSRQACVSDIILNGNWRWPVSNSPDLLTLKQAIPEAWMPDPTSSDTIRWIPSTSGQFSIKSAWQALRVKHATIPWYKLIWFPLAIPKCGFFLWLAIQRRLGTHDRLHLDNQIGRAHV